ncbi:polysaccharide deacetylase family protein [Arundinibacter roseus]|uniref:Polysaccharide deacetylase family protein n=1 Tax=Arundinibacter roseus TaxID=2070510 RepID=A0A4R4KBV9_9BACT|nr:polysaccharide deacetylase family protein [Arundinibacter roseus]TDB63699.1 polysaccharide deacetylase family protein [Arundinibacter roseus]
MKSVSLFCYLLLCIGSVDAQIIRRPIPEKLVVLTFDDGVSTHATTVAPLLKKYGFGGTFFVCEFPPDFADKNKYMSWEQIRQLNEMGFEIGNHTLTHKHVGKLTKAQLLAELDSLESRCVKFGIAKPVNFAYPGYAIHPTAYEVLAEKGYHFARIGGDRPYDPVKDHPFLIPSFTTLKDNREVILKGFEGATQGKIVILTVHGVPDYAHDWVTTPPDLFSEYLDYLHTNKFTVISLRDLNQYINFDEAARALPLPGR